MDQFKGTVYRQTMFAEFELAMGKMAESGQAGPRYLHMGQRSSEQEVL